MKNLVCSIFTVAVMAAATAGAATFTGVVTDTMCGATHDMMKDQPAEQCVKMCAKGEASYALYDGANVLKLSDQKAAAKFAAQRVIVTGTFDPKSKTIKVFSIEAIAGK